MTCNPRSLGWRLFVVRGFSETLLSALRSLSQTPSVVYDCQTLFFPSPLYLSLGFRIEFYLSLGRLSRDVFRILRSMFLFRPRSLSISLREFLFFYCGLERIQCISNSCNRCLVAL